MQKQIYREDMRKTDNVKECNKQTEMANAKEHVQTSDVHTDCIQKCMARERGKEVKGPQMEIN